MNEPCKNPNCHSCGQPHPNCRCYAEGGMVPASDLPEATSEVPASDLPVAASGEVPSSDLPSETDYSTPGQMIAAGAEGAAQGVLGPAAPYLETKLGLATPEDIAGRAKENPIIHGASEAVALGAGLMTGVGEAGLIAKGAEAASKVVQLGKAGSAILKGAIEAASFATSDEVTKAMLNHPGSDPNEPVSAALLHVGAAGLMGAVSGGVFSLGEGMIGKGLEALKNDKVVNQVEKYLAKVGESGDPLGKLTKKMTEGVTDTAAAGVASHTGIGIMGYEALKSVLRPAIEKITGKVTSKANPYVTDAIIKSLITNEASGVPNAIHYATQVGKGVQKALNRIDALFTSGASQIAPEITDAARDELKSFIEEGQVDAQLKDSMQAEPQPAQQFAKGGMVSGTPSSSDRFATVFPEQNTILNTAKGRISKYLNGIRPTANQPKLAFDEKPIAKDQHRSYNRAIDIAVSPLKVLDKVNKGNLTPEDMKHFVSMYPEVHTMLSRRMTERIMKAQLKGEKPSYTKRQAMSLFLGAPLDSTLTPMGIQAAQSVFMNKNMQQQQQAPKKQSASSTKSLSKSSEPHQTADQARAARQVKQ